MEEDKYKKLILILEEGEDVYVETPWVIDLGNDLYQLDNSPFYYYDLALGDIVEAKYSEEEEGLVFVKIVKKSGNKMVRVIFDNPSNEEGPEKTHLDNLVAIGCSFSGANPKYICIEIPAEVNLQIICEYLIKNDINWEYASPSYNTLNPNEK